MVSEDQLEVQRVLQFSSVDGLPDLTLRVQGTVTSNSKGDTYDINTSMVKDRHRRAEAAPFVVFRAEFPKLRVYHVLDLLRLFSIEFNKHQEEARASWLQQRTVVNLLDVGLFPLAVAEVLRDFSSTWDVLDVSEPTRPDPAVYWKIVDAVERCFTERWCSPASVTSPSDESPTQASRNLHSRPTVSAASFAPGMHAV